MRRLTAKALGKNTNTWTDNQIERLQACKSLDELGDCIENACSRCRHAGYCQEWRCAVMRTYRVLENQMPIEHLSFEDVNFVLRTMA